MLSSDLSSSTKNNSNGHRNLHPRPRRPLYPGWGSGSVAYVGTFRAYSLAVLGGHRQLEIGDKIILPQQTLQSINRLRLPFPLIFEIRRFDKLYSSNMLSQNDVLNQYKRRIEQIYRSTNPSKINKIDKWLKKYKNNPHSLYVKICKTYGLTPKSKLNSNINGSGKSKKSKHDKRKSFGKQYCSVYEFSSPQPDSAYLPHWMMGNLGLDEGDKIEIQSQFNMKKGTFAKIQPIKQEFIDKVSQIGYKETLEHSLRHYSVLSVNQRIVVEFNHTQYQLVVKQTKPANAISILGSTDLEVEFDEPLEMSNNDNDNNGTMKATMNDTGNDNNMIDQDNETDLSERFDDSSSLGLSDIDNNNNNYNDIESDIGNDKVIRNKSEIDGTLLKRLGVPLDYNEQTNLATMIIENRKLMKENESRFDTTNNQQCNNDDDDDNEDIDIKTVNDDDIKKEEKQETITDEELTPIGPNDVECNNCGKYINSMSITMHQIYCMKNFIRCKQCKQCIKVSESEKHQNDFHKLFQCLCNKQFEGDILFNKHKLKECKLRLLKCKYCDKNNITAIDYDEHVMQCKESSIECKICKKSLLLKNKFLHDCGVICVLCGERIADTKDKLLHLITSCCERRAICNYCGIFRKCADMEQHRKYCGSRSEQCNKCNEWVSLMNMEPHLQSNCQWFNNNQLSSSVNVEKKMQSLSLKNNKNNNNDKNKKNKKKHNNPYLDDDLLFNWNDDENTNNNNNNNNNDDSLYGLLKSNPKPNLLNTQFAMDAMESSIKSMNKQICPHCIDDDTFMNEEEFQIHIAIKHPKLINDSMTQTVMASFNNPDILNKNKNHQNNNKIHKKKKRRLSSENNKKMINKNNNNKFHNKESQKRQRPSTKNNNIKYTKKNKAIPSKTLHWNCSLCTFANTSAKLRCMMCQTPKPNLPTN